MTAASTAPWADFAMVIFFQGASPEKKVSCSPYENRLTYLRRTLANARQHCHRVAVFICDDHDEATLQEQFPGQEYHRVPCEEHTKHLPYRACLYVQEHGAQMGLTDDSIVYFTEADHLTYFEPALLPEITRVLREHPVYVSMHRMEELYGEQGKGRGLTCALFGHSFVLPNTTRELASQPSSVYHPAFYQSRADHEAYAGAHFSAFRTFRAARLPKDISIELEVASHMMFHSFPCLKTRNILGSYLIHLSGYDYHALCNNHGVPPPGVVSPLYAPEEI